MRERKLSSSTARSQKKAAATPPATREGQPSGDEITRSAPFRKATAEAESCVNDPERLQELLVGTREKINLLVIVAAMIYFVSPFDVIPDSVPILGHIDDAMVVRLALESVRGDLDTFMAWETSRV